MTTFLLVHGGWHGGWAFRAVAIHLQKAGHEVYRPTLAGVAERAWEARLGINIQTHVDELKALVDWEDLDDMVLLAHSYGGFAATALADAIPERFRAIVYLDSFVAEDGDTPFHLVPRPESLVVDTAGDDGLTMKLRPGDAMSRDIDHERRVAGYEIVHPVGTMMQRIRLSGRYKEIPKKAYILAVGADGNSQAPHFQRYHQAATQHPEWDAYTLSGGHNLMLDDPDGVAAILRRYSDDNHERISDDV